MQHRQFLFQCVNSAHAAHIGGNCASTRDEYVNIALGFASGRDSLAAERSSLRAKVGESALFDARRFARDLEAAWRGMWQTWCRTAETDRNGRTTEPPP